MRKAQGRCTTEGLPGTLGPGGCGQKGGDGLEAGSHRSLASVPLTMPHPPEWTSVLTCVSTWWLPPETRALQPEACLGGREMRGHVSLDASCPGAQHWAPRAGRTLILQEQLCPSKECHSSEESIKILILEFCQITNLKIKALFPRLTCFSFLFLHFPL